MSSERRRYGFLAAGFATGAVAVTVGLPIAQMATDKQLTPFDPWANCGNTVAVNPSKTRVGVYDENPDFRFWGKLREAEFIDSIAVAARTREEFLYYQSEIKKVAPNVKVKFWALLPTGEGYFPGPFSDRKGVKRLISEVGELPVVWDSELPYNWNSFSPVNWYENKDLVDKWLKKRKERVDVWRSYDIMGPDPLFLRWAALHVDPNEYPNVYLHLDLYATGKGFSNERLMQILRCGVEKYGDKFIPSFGMLSTGKKSPETYITMDTLKRYLKIAQKAGVSEVWLHSLEGLNSETIAAIRESLYSKIKDLDNYHNLSDRRIVHKPKNK